MQKKAISLQQRLIKNAMLSSIAAGVVALLLLLAFSIYQTMQTQDNIMDEISDMLLVSDLTVHAGRQLDELSDEFDIAYQLKFAQQVLTESKDFPLHSSTQQQPEGRVIPQQLDVDLAAHHDGHFSYFWHDQQLWRSYYAHDVERQLQVQLYQPMHERFNSFFYSFGIYAVCLMLLWLLQWLFLYVVVKKQFRAIQNLSEEISAKNVDDLTPIQSQYDFVELQPMINQLNLMLQRLQHALIAEQRLTADASHELRSPLSAIKMRLQVLQRKYAQSATGLAEDLVSIQEDVNRGTRILENLLLLARLDPTALHDLPKQGFNFAALVDEVLASLKPFARKKHLRIELLPSYAAGAIQSEAAHGDDCIANRELIFICIRNLIDNAIAYTEPEGQIRIQLRAEQQQIYFQIQDDGQQLTAEVLSRMGERFYRALGSQTPGSGLGLSICNKIMELHQGEIQFQRAELGGLQVDLMFRSG